jgi:hypothetical protein
MASSNGFFDDRETAMLHSPTRREIDLAPALIRRIVGAQVEYTPVGEAGAQQ